MKILLKRKFFADMAESVLRTGISLSYTSLCHTARLFSLFSFHTTPKPIVPEVSLETPIPFSNFKELFSSVETAYQNDLH